MKKIFVTGGAGFIGSNFVRRIFHKYPDYEILVFDLLTYAGNPANLADVLDDKRVSLVQGDIRDAEAVRAALPGSSMLVNFAAESFVDRSILDPDSFITTDVLGTFVLLQAARELGVERFLQVSTDEVYGSVEEGSSVETDGILPNSPYSASKAGGDLLARSYCITYDLPVVVTRGSNTYGPYQHPEKLVPLFISNAIDDKQLPVYGDGGQVRDWLHVDDHCSAIDLALHEGVPGEAYNVGGGNERTNMEITKLILESLDKPDSLIKYVADRPGHDRRYSLNCDKLKALGWNPTKKFEDGLRDTVEWYLHNQSWWRKAKDSDSYREFDKAWLSDVSSGDQEIRAASGAVVIAKNVANMHVAPDRSSEQVSQAILGQVALTYDESPGWLRVKTPDQYTGWIESRFTVSDIRGRSYASSGRIVKITNLFARVLNWPDPKAEIITKAVIGTELETADEQDDWVIVRLPDSKPGAVRRFAVELVDRAVYPLPLSPTGYEIVATAKRFVGTPYLWGGVTAFGLDCSGFVQLVHKLHGLALPRDAHQQAEDNSFTNVGPDSVLPGDLMFFGSPGSAQAGRSITHVAIALGGGKFIHSSGGAGVNISEITDPYYAPMFRLARRLI